MGRGASEKVASNLGSGGDFRRIPCCPPQLPNGCSRLWHILAKFDDKPHPISSGISTSDDYSLSDSSLADRYFFFVTKGLRLLSKRGKPVRITVFFTFRILSVSIPQSVEFSD